jgi:hypothetical protein
LKYADTFSSLKPTTYELKINQNVQQSGGGKSADNDGDDDDDSDDDSD